MEGGAITDIDPNDANEGPDAAPDDTRDVATGIGATGMEATGMESGPIDYTDDAATFGDRLVAARIGAGLKRKALARKIGVKTETLRHWEDDRSEPRANRLTLLAGMLGVPLIWLMTGQGTGPKTSMDGGDASDADAESADDDRRDALLAEFAAARAEVMSANRRLARVEQNLKRLLLQDDL